MTVSRFFYNAVQIRREKLRDVWRFTDAQIRALYDIAKADGFNTVGLPIWWNEVQPDQMYTPTKAVTIIGGQDEVDSGNMLELRHGASPTEQKHACLEYDFSGLTGTIAAAMIRVYVQNLSNGPGVIEVYGITDTAVLLDSVTVTNSHFFDLDVTAYIQQRTGSGKANFELRLRPDSNAVIQIDRMSEADTDGINYVAYNHYLLSLTQSGVRYPPTLRISRDDVYDWGIIEQMIQEVEDAGLKLELLWFGSDTTNYSQDDRLPYYVQRNYQKALDNNGNLLLRKNSAGNWMNYGVYTFYMDKLDPHLRAREKTVIKAMFNRIAEYNAAHGDAKTVVGCQVNNETSIWTRRFGFSGRYRSPYSDQRWEEGEYTSVYQFMMDIRAEWLSYLAAGVKESNYSVWTRQNNVGTEGDTIPENELLRETTGTHLDFYGMDFYRYSELDKIYQSMLNEHSRGKNFPMVMETDWTVTGSSSGSPSRIPDYGILLAFAANGAHHQYDLIGPDNHNFYIRGANNTAIPGETVAGANYDWNTQTRNTNHMLQKIWHDLASRRTDGAGGKRLAFFNPFAKDSVNAVNVLDGYQFEYVTDNRGVGIAIRRSEEEFVLASKTASVFKLPAQIQVQSASIGYYDQENQWVSQESKSFTTSNGRYVFAMGAYEVVRFLATPLPPQAELLSWYPFENNANDQVGTHHGTAQPDMQYAPGIAGDYAANPNGSNYILLSTGAYPKAGFGNGLNAFTYSAWVKRGAYSGARYLLGNVNSGSNTAFHLEINAAGRFSFWIREDGGAGTWIHSPDGAISTDQWHHVAVTCDGVTLTGYVDGIQAATGAFPLSKFSDWQYPMVFLARNVRGSVEGRLIGLVDDLRVYDGAMTQKEIAKLWQDVTGQIVCLKRPTFDFTGDCMVGIGDLILFASEWLQSNRFCVKGSSKN